jgi:putative membrane protein insertion efficiency factor
MKKFLYFVINIPKELLKILIRLYQILFSFDHSFWSKYVNYRVCIYEPSCSEYTYKAVDKFGVIKGSVMGFFRVLRCSPGHRGGDDPVPEKFSTKRSR